MNIVSFILALAGAGLSLFQPVIPFMNLSVSDLLSSRNSDLSSLAGVALVIAIIAVICGICALTRKGKSLCVTALVICGGLYLLSAGMFTASPNRNSLASAMSGMAMQVWMKTALVWALCYLGAAVCAYFDKPAEPTTSYSSTSTGFSFSTRPSSPSHSPSPIKTSPSHSKAQKTFEPVLGVETSALIKRAHLFLSENDFDEADRYFEQAVRQDPENSAAYLGKLMAELKVHNIDELSVVTISLAENKSFQYALRFANDDEKADLQKYLEANKTHIEAVKQEEQKRNQEEERKRKELDELNQKYDDAIKTAHSGEEYHDSKTLERAAEMLDKLGDFKDSRRLAESFRQKAVEEQRAIDEGEHAAKTANILVFAFVIIAIVVIFILNYR